MHSHHYSNTTSHTTKHQEKNKKFLLISFIISVILSISKCTIGILINSSALIASSIDSLMDAFSTSINGFILHISSKPADTNHPFGHGKFEAFSGLLQGTVIIISSCSLFIYSLLNILNHTPENTSFKNIQLLGIIITLISIITPLILSYYMKRQAKASSSIVLEAEQAHFFTDGLMNFGVLIGLLMVYFFHIYWIDSIIGISIALWLMWDIKDLFIESFNILTDKTLPKTLLKKLSLLLDKSVQHHIILGWHNLQTRRSGSEYHINIHLEFEDTILLKDAHEQSLIIEKNIQQILPNAIIFTHFDLHSEYLTSPLCKK